MINVVFIHRRFAKSPSDATADEKSPKRERKPNASASFCACVCVHIYRDAHACSPICPSVHRRPRVLGSGRNGSRKKEIYNQAKMNPMVKLFPHRPEEP